MGKWRYKKKSPMFRIRSRDKSISLLLGAGFSAPMGYPIGCQLNKSLLACIGDTFAFSPAGELVASTNGTKPNLGCKNPYDWYFPDFVNASPKDFARNFY